MRVLGQWRYLHPVIQITAVTHTCTQKHTHTLYHSLFLPSRSFSGVSAVYQSLAGPVPFAVIAATWKLYWLPFSRPGKRKREWKHVIMPSSFSCCTAVKTRVCCLWPIHNQHGVTVINGHIWTQCHSRTEKWNTKNTIPQMATWGSLSYRLCGDCCLNWITPIFGFL